jgi:hypothetical protein
VSAFPIFVNNNTPVGQCRKNTLGIQEYIHA